MPRSLRFVFLHGGPGFNSYAEQAILGPVLRSAGHDVRFWNEPSRLRPGGDPFEPEHAFESWLASAERFVVTAAAHAPVHLIAHSVSVHAAADIALRHPSRVAGLVLAAPSADLFAVFTNVLRLARADLLDAKPEIAASIASSLTRTRAVLDDAMREGLVNVLHDDRLFSHYWTDAEQLNASMAAGSGPEAQFDPNSFFAVLAGLGSRGADLLSNGPVAVPALALFGADDPIAPRAEQDKAVRAAFPRARIEVFDGCSHYLHLDRPQRFADAVVDWARQPTPHPFA